MRAVAVIAAGGSGERLGADQPKALVVCAGRSLLAWCLEAALAAESVVAVVVAAHASALPEFEAEVAALTGAAGDKPVAVVAGGRTRSHSVRAGLEAAARLGREFDAVAVHDAARPLVRPQLFDECVAWLSTADCVVAALPATDTIKLVDAEQVVVETPDRDGLWAVQTPQVFRRECLERALAVDDDTLAAASDDASLAEAIGARVQLHRWDAPNLKVTTATDLAIAAQLLRGGD